MVFRPILNNCYVLDDLREHPVVTVEVLKEAADLPVQGKLALSIAVRYRQSGRGLASRYAQAIKDGELAAALIRPAHFPNIPSLS